MDNFNFTPEDVSNISKTFQQSARRDRDEREERREGRGFWGDLGMTLATGIAQQAVVAPVVESVASYVRKPYEDRDNVFFANFKNEEIMQKNIARRAEVFRATHEKGIDDGMSPQEIAASYHIPRITREINKRQSAGEFADKDGVPLGLEFLDKEVGGSTIRENIIQQLAMKKVMANDGELYKNYMTAYKEAGDVSLGPEASKDFKANILRFNSTASSWVDTIKRIATRTSKQEIIDAGVKNAKDSIPEFAELKEASDAFKIYDEYKTPDTAREAFDKVELIKLIKEVPERAFEDVTNNVISQRIVKDGELYLQTGVRTLTVNNRTGEKTYNFTETELVSMKTNADRAKLIPTIASTLNMLTKDFTPEASLALRTKINETFRNSDGVAYNLGSNVDYMNDPNFLANHAATVKMIQEEGINPNNYRDNMTENLKKMRIATTEEIMRTQSAFDKRMTDAGITEFIIDKKKQVTNPEWILHYNAHTANIHKLEKRLYGITGEALILAEDNKTTMPLYHKLNKQGNAVPDPRYTDKTVADFEVAAAKYEGWKKGIPFTRKKEDELRTSLASGDKPLFKSEDGKTLVLDTSTGDYVAIPTVVATPEVTPDTETETKVTAVPTLTDTQKDELMAKAFPEENNVDIDEVFPSVVKQFSAAIQKDKDTIRKEMWVESPEATTRAGQVAGQTVRSITYPVKEIYYNFLKPFGALGEAVVGEIVQEVGGLWEASTEALNNKDVDFMLRTNQIHTVLELKAERPNFKKEISEAAEKLFLMNPKIETGRLKQGIANLVFDSKASNETASDLVKEIYKDINKTVSDAEVDNEKTSATSSILSPPKEEKKSPENLETKTFADGTEYVGEYKDGKRHGKGTLTFGDGNTFVGEWKNGATHGKGTLTMARSGRVTEGIWKNGSFVR